jgi:2-keto-3-deoxy-L-fuconate dehydrogenase
MAAWAFIPHEIFIQETIMSDRLKGKTCLVTGAAQGAGNVICKAFLAEGAIVLATDLQLDKLNAEFPDAKVRKARLDVTDAAACMALAKEHSDINVLVNCAGWVANGSLLSGAPEDLDKSFLINVTSMSNTIRAFLPAMLEKKDGSIINIASVVSSVMAAPNRFAYGVTKAAVIGLTMSVACDFITSGVRCNSISPGTFESPSLQERMRAAGDYEKSRAAFIARQPMGRLGTPEEVAAIAVMLASNEAPFMTGSNIVIDGGMSL